METTFLYYFFEEGKNLQFKDSWYVWKIIINGIEIVYIIFSNQVEEEKED